MLKLLTVLSKSCFVTKVWNSSMGLHINLGQNISFTFFLRWLYGNSLFFLLFIIQDNGDANVSWYSFQFSICCALRVEGCGSYHMVINNAPTLCSGPGILLNDCFTDCSQRKLFHYLWKYFYFYLSDSYSTVISFLLITIMSWISPYWKCLIIVIWSWVWTRYIY